MNFEKLFCAGEKSLVMLIWQYSWGWSTNTTFIGLPRNSSPARWIKKDYQDEVSGVGQSNKSESLVSD